MFEFVDENALKSSWDGNAIDRTLNLDLGLKQAVKE